MNGKSANRYSDTTFCDVGCLGAFRSLDNLKFDGVSFLQSSVAFTRDGRIVHKHIWTVIAPDEAVPFGIVKPLHRSLHVKGTSCPGTSKVKTCDVRPKAVRHSKAKSRGVYQNGTASQ